MTWATRRRNRLQASTTEIVTSAIAGHVGESGRAVMARLLPPQLDIANCDIKRMTALCQFVTSDRAVCMRGLRGTEGHSVRNRTQRSDIRIE